MKKKGSKLKSKQSSQGSENGHSALSNGNGEDLSKSIEELSGRIAEELLFHPHEKASDSSREGSQQPSSAQQTELLQALKQLRQKLSSIKGGAASALQDKGLAALLTQIAAKEGSDGRRGPAEYMEMKVQLLLNYIACLCYYLVLKTGGLPVREHPVVPKMIWMRSLLEKLKPVDQRLQYQMSKMLQWAEVRKTEALRSEDLDGAEQVDVRALKPGQLASSIQDEDDDEEEDDNALAEPNDHLGAVYRPPKIAQVEYTGDHVAMQERAERELERKKARLERSEFVRGLREEFTDAPREVQAEIRSDRADKMMRLMREQQEYEEDNMTRLRMKKTEARAMRNALRDSKRQSGGVESIYDASSDFDQLARSLAAGGGSKGKGKGKGKRRSSGGNVAQEYQEAKRKLQQTRESVASAMEGARGGKGGGRGKGLKRKR
eukprot:TRINITY_DN2822_c1_g1_i1.p1 TRINITY_DN2822_c1_g1~~TRINITY_DN2822_c1_g1_i1.p1  ORF type:complete len:434 (+),score=122.61 TRINITY_DN2822_c1_g1_i1:49-1350(+)